MADRNTEFGRQIARSVLGSGVTTHEELIPGRLGERRHLRLPLPQDRDHPGLRIAHSDQDTVRLGCDVIGRDPGHPASIQSGSRPEGQECSSRPALGLG